MGEGRSFPAASALLPGPDLNPTRRPAAWEHCCRALLFAAPLASAYR